MLLQFDLEVRWCREFNACLRKMCSGCSEGDLATGGVRGLKGGGSGMGRGNAMSQTAVTHAICL